MMPRFSNGRYMDFPTCSEGAQSMVLWYNTPRGRACAKTPPPRYKVFLGSDWSLRGVQSTNREALFLRTGSRHIKSYQLPCL